MYVWRTKESCEALASFCGGQFSSSQPAVLLKYRCLDDVDDEVRDRAALYIKVLDEKQLADVYIREGEPVRPYSSTADGSESTFSLATLEAELVAYVKDDARHTAAFDLSTIPKVSRETAAAEISQRPSALDTISAVSPSPKAPESSTAPSTSAEIQSSYASQLAAIPELSAYGSVLKSSPRPIPLTESETEYVITLVKHIFKAHVVFQFNVSNTIPDTVLEQVGMVMVPAEGSLTEDFVLPIPALTSSAGSLPLYVSFSRDEPSTYAAGSFGCTLKFVSKEVDPTSGEPEDEGYQDEYQVEECDLGAGDVSLSEAAMMNSSS